VTLWGYDVDDDVNLPQSPLEDGDFHSGSFLDRHTRREQEREPDQNAATPTNDTAWSSDEELTPLFSSNFPTTPGTKALRQED
jgi:hypothetical protein